MMLAQLIRTYREHHRLSLRQMAKRVGIHYCALHRLESGQSVNQACWTQLWVWLLEKT